jgi:hypothetical protein
MIDRVCDKKGDHSPLCTECFKIIRKSPAFKALNERMAKDLKGYRGYISLGTLEEGGELAELAKKIRDTQRREELREGEK